MKSKPIPKMYLGVDDPVGGLIPIMYAKMASKDWMEALADIVVTTLESDLDAIESGDLFDEIASNEQIMEDFFNENRDDTLSHFCGYMATDHHEKLQALIDLFPIREEAEFEVPESDVWEECTKIWVEEE